MTFFEVMAGSVALLCVQSPAFKSCYCCASPYWIFDTTDLATWIERATLTNELGTATFTDELAPATPHRFYRAVTK